MTIVSGGQTGVDRAAWDVARSLGLPQEGWVPKGRRAEDGPIPARYICRETASEDYSVRTEKNVVDSDATLLIGFAPPTGGTLFTMEMCRKHRKAHLFVDLNIEVIDEALRRVLQFLKEKKPERLNVAGPRGSSHPEVYRRAYDFLSVMLST